MYSVCFMLGLSQPSKQTKNNYKPFSFFAQMQIETNEANSSETSSPKQKLSMSLIKWLFRIAGELLSYLEVKISKEKYPCQR